MARAFFFNAKIIIDHFHIVRFRPQAMDDARKSVQKQLLDDQRRCFKRLCCLLLKHHDELSNEARTALWTVLSQAIVQTFRQCIRF